MANRVEQHFLDAERQKWVDQARKERIQNDYKDRMKSDTIFHSAETTKITQTNKAKEEMENNARKKAKKNAFRDALNYQRSQVAKEKAWNIKKQNEKNAEVVVEKEANKNGTQKEESADFDKNTIMSPSKM